MVAADALPATRSVQGATDRSAQQSRSALAADPTRARRGGSLRNYRIGLKVEHEGQAGQQFSLVMVEGSAELNTVDPNPVQIDGNSVPSVVTLSATLQEVSEGQCELTLVFGRSVPFVSGMMGGPNGPTRSTVQQVHVGLSTSLILKPGQSIVVQDTDKEQVTITLSRVE